MKDLITIVCPYCGQHYLPSEVYLPNSFFGVQKEIFRKADGTIDFFVGSEPDLKEEFECENCGKKLMVTANLSFNVEAEEFTDEYITPIDKPNKLHLEEESLFD